MAQPGSAHAWGAWGRWFKSTRPDFLFNLKGGFLNRFILLTNDDSIFSPGIIALENYLKELGDILVVAPDREKSAVSFGLTTTSPLRINKVDKSHYAINGTPVDCVYMATKIIAKRKPDIVVSGINLGANLGEDTIYSGTVAGAFQASLLGIPSIAISSIENKDRKYDLESAGDIINKIVRYIFKNPLPEGKILSINVPRSPNGVKITHLGHKRYEAEITKNRDPRGREYYWIGPGKITTFGSNDSDVNVVKNGYASVTPLSLNFSDEQLYTELKEKENEIFKTMV